MDRKKKDELPKMQVGFIDFVCMPLYKILADLLPSLTYLHDGVSNNRKNWQMLVDEPKGVSCHVLVPLHPSLVANCIPLNVNSLHTCCSMLPPFLAQLLRMYSCLNKHKMWCMFHTFLLFDCSGISKLYSVTLRLIIIVCHNVALFFLYELETLENSMVKFDSIIITKHTHSLNLSCSHGHTYTHTYIHTYK